MKIRVSLLLVVALAGFMLPVYAQEDTLTTFQDDLITFSYDPMLGTAVEASLVEAIPYDDETMPLWGVTPGYISYSLTDYPQADKFFLPPTISVYQTATFADYNMTGGEIAYGYSVELEALQTMLADETDLSAYTAWNTNGDFNLPYLPLANAAQVFRIQPTYLDFQNGSGIRYLTYYSQAVDPLTEGSIFYTFQGVTEDGSAYISVMMPIWTGLLPETIDYNAFDYDAFAADYVTYMEETSAALQAQEGDAYTPTLAQLDALVSSIAVTTAE